MKKLLIGICLILFFVSNVYSQECVDYNYHEGVMNGNEWFSDATLTLCTNERYIYKSDEYEEGEFLLEDDVFLLFDGPVLTSWGVGSKRENGLYFQFENRYGRVSWIYFVPSSNLKKYDWPF